MSTYNIITRDVIYLELGDMILVDGILINRHGIKYNESLVIGELDLLYKTLGNKVYKALI
jgi:magnesium-transporting ATPase (P-type)